MRDSDFLSSLRSFAVFRATYARSQPADGKSVVLAFRNAAHAPVAPDRRRKRARAVVELLLFFPTTTRGKRAPKAQEAQTRPSAAGKATRRPSDAPEGVGAGYWSQSQRGGKSTQPPVIARVAFRHVWRGMYGMVIAGIIMGKNGDNRRQFAARCACLRSVDFRPRQRDARRCRHRPASLSASARRRRGCGKAVLVSCNSPAACEVAI